MTGTTRTRRTQAERSAATQQALLDAAVECLVELGYGRTTTTEVTRRAGVSPGALLHHYPTKADLLAAAVGHVMRRRQEEFRKSMANIAPGADRIDAAIDLLWEAVNEPVFAAWLELWVGARTDPELAAAVRAMEEEYERGSRAIFLELFPPDEYPRAFLELGMRFAISLLDGVALRGLVIRPPDPTPVELLKAIAHERLERPASERSD